jgi:hypothetical protein
MAKQQEQDVAANGWSRFSAIWIGLTRLFLVANIAVLGYFTSQIGVLRAANLDQESRIVAMEASSFTANDGLEVWKELGAKAERERVPTRAQVERLTDEMVAMRAEISRLVGVVDELQRRMPR